jgi:hypothetical protein
MTYWPKNERDGILKMIEFLSWNKNELREKGLTIKNGRLEY